MFRFIILNMFSPYINFPGGSVGRNLPANEGDMGSVPGSKRFPGKGNGNPLQYSCLKNPMDSRAWQAIVHGVARVRYCSD